MRDDQLADGHSRRRFLTVAGGTLVGTTAVGVARQANSQQATQTFQFGGRVQGWQGKSPASIQGKKNPTLQLQTGRVYEVRWTNLDGQPHDFALQNSNDTNLEVIYPNVQTNPSGGGGDVGGSGETSGGNATPPSNAISKTEIVSKKGATQTLRFVATNEIDHYICTIHPTTMVGNVETHGGGGSGESGDHSGGNDDGDY